MISPGCKPGSTDLHHLSNPGRGDTICWSLAKTASAALQQLIRTVLFWSLGRRNVAPLRGLEYIFLSFYTQACSLGSQL
jgi:hypothetical protein